MWTGNCPNCGEPHGSAALKVGDRVLCLVCLTPFECYVAPGCKDHPPREKPAKRQQMLMFDDDRDQT